MKAVQRSVTTNRHEIPSRLGKALLLLVVFRCFHVPTVDDLFVRADWGDYADHSFQCPALTTCQRVCVANVTDCPPEMTCNGTATLCPDGSCSTAGLCGEDTGTSPCEHACAPVACAKVIDYYDTCLSKYGTYYDNETACAEEEQAATTNLYTFTEPQFVGLYCYFSAVTAAVVLWCAFNQRFFPRLPQSTKPLQVSAPQQQEQEEGGKKVAGKSQKILLEHDSLALPTLSAHGGESSDTVRLSSGGRAGDADPRFNDEEQKEIESPSASFQTGYRLHPLGLLLWVAVLVTIVGIQALLAYLTIMYYVQQDAITRIPKAFEDEVQVLLAFEYLWSTFLSLIKGHGKAFAVVSA
jgi:hypothetical protein